MPADGADIGAAKAPDAAPKAGTKARLRSLGDLDRRTRAYQDTVDLTDRIVADLGGADRLSAMQGELVTAAALMGAMLKDAGARYLSGEAIDLAEFVTVANAQRRHLNDLGLHRQPRDVTPSLQDIIAGRASR